MMALIQVFIDMNCNAPVIFGTIALLRGIQGFAMGIMHLFVQVRKYIPIYFLVFILNCVQW